MITLCEASSVEDQAGMLRAEVSRENGKGNQEPGDRSPRSRQGALRFLDRRRRGDDLRTRVGPGKARDRARGRARQRRRGVGSDRGEPDEARGKGRGGVREESQAKEREAEII